ncbi:protein kinase, ATP binding site-containing protein [Tanacetum coccineum]
MVDKKSACQAGWYTDEDKDCLLIMVDKASLGYYNLDNGNDEPTNGYSVSEIISRFYPRMRVEQILASFDVKAGERKSVAVMMGYRVATLRITHSTSDYGSYPQLLYLASLSEVLKLVCRHFRQSASSLPILQLPICSGTWVPKIEESNRQPLAILRPNSSLRAALNLFVQSEFPLLMTMTRWMFTLEVKGKLAHSQGPKIVAVKRLDRRNGQGDVEFWNEITILSSYQHENIVSLLGYCDESGERILIYEYVTRGSLDYQNGPLQRVLHCDIKSSNILLDENWNSKISDFGLANIGNANPQISVVVTNPVGTYGYCDPVFAEIRFLMKESDAYSLGVVLFKILFGRLCTDKPPFLKVVNEFHEQNRIEEIIFGNIKDKRNSTSLELFTTIAYQCLKEDREECPLVIHIVRALEAAVHCKMNNIKFSEQPVGILNVKIIKAIDLKKVLGVFAPNTYVNLRLTKDEEDVTSKKTIVVNQDVNPEWNEEFSLLVKNLDVQALEILDESTDGQWINVVPLKHFRPEQRETYCLDLFKNMYSQNSKSYGQIMVDNVANRSKESVWNEKFEFTFDKSPTDRILILYVYGSSTWLQSFTGWNDFSVSDNYIKISLAEIVNKKHTNKIYQLASSKFGDAGLRVEMEWRYLARIPQFSTTKVLGVRFFDFKEQQGIDRINKGSENKSKTYRGCKGAQGDHEAEVIQVSNYDTAVAQRRLKDKQPEEKTNMDCLRSTQQCMKSEVTKYLGVAGIQQQNGLVDETNVTLFAKVLHGFEFKVESLGDHTFEVEPQEIFDQGAAEKIYAYESLTFNNTVACEVISMWKARLKDDMDARSDISHEYQMVCTRLDIASADVIMLDKFDRGLQTNVQVFVDFDYAMGRSITALSTTKTGYMTFTEVWKKEIWLKGLLIESGYELRLVAGIATSALVKGCSRSEVPAYVEVVAYRY